MRPTRSKLAFALAAGGGMLVVAFCTLGALQILVLNPLAAAPGLTLPEIHAALAAAGESASPAPVTVFVAIGLALAGAVFAYATAVPDASPVLVTILLLLILTFGAPAYFAASFPMGMSLADTFGISGGDHSGWSIALYLASTLAFVCAILVTRVLAIRAGRSAPSEAGAARARIRPGSPSRSPRIPRTTSTSPERPRHASGRERSALPISDAMAAGSPKL